MNLDKILAAATIIATIVAFFVALAEPFMEPVLVNLLYSVAGITWIVPGTWMAIRHYKQNS